MVVVPNMGESVTSGIVAAWLKDDGAYIGEGEELFELETDKATMAVPSTVSGVLKRMVQEGDEVEVGDPVAEIDTASGAGGAATAAQRTSAVAAKTSTEQAAQSSANQIAALSPAVRRIVEEYGIDVELIEATGKDGRILKEDALRAAEKKSSGQQNKTASVQDEPEQKTQVERSVQPAGDTGTQQRSSVAAERQTRVKMSSLRKRIAENLVSSRQSSAHLTTFNEIDMTKVMALRAQYKEQFEKKHGVRLGFMSFFVRASCNALAEFPLANAIIDGDDVVYNNYFNIGVAVSTDRGLIVPVIHEAQTKEFADIESTIISFAKRAQDKKLSVDELTGGTFTITNGGVFGSLLSTPIPTPPQSAILGMHAIQQRPVAIGDEIAIRPMMYVALTYDHRIMDGREAVRLLVKIKQLVEDPQQMLLDL